MFLAGVATTSRAMTKWMLLLDLARQIGLEHILTDFLMVDWRDTGAGDLFEAEFLLAEF